MDLTRFTIDETGTAKLQTSKGVLMLDAGDLSVLAGVGIKIKKTGYADLYTYTKPRKRIGALARLIMNAPTGKEVDHINHDTLDNRRSNLRVCSRGENRRNSYARRGHSSRFKGVTYHDARRWNQRCTAARPWRALTRVQGKRVELGYHATDIQAAMAYNRFAATAFGEFACFNRFDTCPLWVLPPLSDSPAKLCEAQAIH